MANRRTVKGWTDSYAHNVSDEVRIALSQYADDIAHAMLKEAKAAFKDVLDDIYERDAGKADAKRWFDDRMQLYYEVVTDGARDAVKKRG